MGSTVLGGPTVLARGHGFGLRRAIDILRAHRRRLGEQYWEGADLVMEVVGDDDRRRDAETKRREYARAGILEYLQVDPRLGRITVLKLDHGRFAVHGEFQAGARAASALLEGFQVDVAAAFAAARRESRIIVGAVRPRNRLGSLRAAA